MDIENTTLDAWAAPYRGWNYHPDHVIPPDGGDPDFGFTMTDCPLVWRHGDEWRMFFTGFDERGYQTALAVSDDLVQWHPREIVMSFGEEGTFDHGGVAICAALFDSSDIAGPRTLKRWKGKYWTLYSCYPRQGGYEIRPGYEGAAWSEDGETWHRASKTEPILSINGAAEWEKDCIYAPWLIEHDGEFWNFYNAANGPIEQMGIVTSDNLLEWERYESNPIIRNGPEGSYDQEFCSDGKVFRDGDHWTMLYFGVGRGGAHIMAAFSRDLLHWTKHPEPLYIAGGNPSGLDRQYAHKISIVRNPENDTYYMFYCAVGDKGRGIGLITRRPIE